MVDNGRKFAQPAVATQSCLNWVFCLLHSMKSMLHPHLCHRAVAQDFNISRIFSGTCWTKACSPMFSSGRPSDLSGFRMLPRS